MKRRIFVALAVLVAFAVYGVVRSRRMISAQMPRYTEVPEGPRAPARWGFGKVSVGTSTLEQVKAETAGFDCEDRSMAALVNAGVARHDSLAHRFYGWLNPHSRNPQVRWHCRAPQGTLLFIFDAPDRPLRHWSARWETNEPGAVEQRVGLEEKFGAPALKSPVQTTWEWADLRVALTTDAIDGGVLLTLTEEVPWPVRAGP